MKLALIRHAEAVVLGENGTRTDFDRMLTPYGHTQAESLATALQKLHITPGLILSSPLVRAWQTAEPLAKTLTPGREPMHCEFLASGDCRFKKLTKQAADFNQAVTFMVGHMPDLSEYASWLIGGGLIDFEKAAIAFIKFTGMPSKGGGELKWLVPPEWFLPFTPLPSREGPGEGPEAANA